MSYQIHEKEENILMGKKINWLELSSAIGRVQNREKSFSLILFKEYRMLYFWLLLARIEFLDCLDH